MIHAYHVIFGAYGFWLPNDPKGSWSDFVGRWELFRFGKATKSLNRRELTPEEERVRQIAKSELKFSPVVFSGKQALAIGHGFKNACSKSGFTIWSCSILPEHVHAVIARHTYEIEQVVGLLKGEATKALNQERLSPFKSDAIGKVEQSPWAQHCWKVYLEGNDSIEAATRYVEENPVKEGKPKQDWSFVTPFRGIEENGWITYH